MVSFLVKLEVLSQRMNRHETSHMVANVAVLIARDLFFYD
jgi:hypothetical protein